MRQRFLKLPIQKSIKKRMNVIFLLLHCISKKGCHIEQNQFLKS